MATPTGWNSTTEPLCGENDPFGRIDTANKYGKGLWDNFTAEHNQDSGTHKLGGYCIFESGSFSNDTGDVVVSLSRAASNIVFLEIFSVSEDVYQVPVFSCVNMAADETKEIWIAGFNSDQIKDIDTLGEFTVGEDDAVNAQSGSITYYYNVWYTV